MGIAEEHQERIFELFHRLQPQPSAETGTGMGLAIARKAIERLGGTVLLQSELGVGSVFTIRLPKQRSLAKGESFRSHL